MAWATRLIKVLEDEGAIPRSEKDDGIEPEQEKGENQAQDRSPGLAYVAEVRA